MKGMVAPIIVLVMVMSCLVFESTAKDHMVGGDKGWTYGNIGSFPFYPETVIMAGDVLVFKYDNTKHNVVQVGSEDFANCEANPGKRWNSGYDRITLPQVGTYYFLSTFDKDCTTGGMRFGVYAGGDNGNSSCSERVIMCMC